MTNPDRGTTLHLVRTEESPDGIFGTLAVPFHGILYTCEDDRVEGVPGTGYAIPAGSYSLRRTIYHKGGYETFEVCDVPNRSRILIHPGNTEDDTRGCILLGTRRGWLMVPDEDAPGNPPVEKRAVVDSQIAFHKFMDWMGPFDHATLEVEG